MKAIRSPLAGLCLLLPALTMAANAVDEQIQRGVEAYQAGHYQQAIQALQLSIEQLQDLLNQQYLKLLPDAPPGWEASEAQLPPAEVAASLGGGLHVSREYRRGTEKVEIQLIANSPMLSALGAIISNPDILKSNPGVEPYSYEGYSGLRKKQPQGEEIALLLDNTILIKVTGTQLESEQAPEPFLEALDFDKLKQTLNSP